MFIAHIKTLLQCSCEQLVKLVDTVKVHQRHNVSTGFSQHTVCDHRSSPVRRYKNETNVGSLLCVFQRRDVVYGHRCGSTVGAELLQAVFLHAAQLSPGEVEGALEGRVGVAHTARHGGNPQVIHWHVALTQGRLHFLTRFGTSSSQDPRYVSPSGNK